MAERVDILQFRKGSQDRKDDSVWEESSSYFNNISKDTGLLNARVLFLKTKPFTDDEPLRKHVDEISSIPAFFWNAGIQRSNGFFRAVDKNGASVAERRYCTCFRLILKRVVPYDPSTDRNYKWDEVNVCCSWTKNSLISLICFDFPPYLQQDLVAAIKVRPAESSLDYFIWMHECLVALFVDAYERAVWSVRDAIRSIEKMRSIETEEQFNFPFLHDLARHAIHSVETLIVVQDSMSCLKDYVTLILKGCPPDPASVSATPELDFQLQRIKSLKARAESNQARMQNEINLAFNIVAQRDTRSNLYLAEAARRDSNATRQIAFLTLLFFPATFVSAIFSTTFFIFVPESTNQSAKWLVSEKFWVFWVVTVPLTVLTYVLWNHVQKRTQIELATARPRVMVQQLGKA